MKKNLLLCLGVLTLFVAVMSRMDRFFFKSNKSFSIQMILSTLTAIPEWKTEPLAYEEREQLLDVFSQKFRYLDRGGQSAVFISEDNNYVIKFYRFPSHLRPLGWIKHPFSYRLTKKRAMIKEHNFEKLDITFGSFLLAYTELKKESGLLFLHLNPTTDLNLTITLIDHLNNHYLVDLDSVTFALQHKADGIFSTLHTHIQKGETQEAKQRLSSLLHLITSRCKKGIIDNDAILEQNYGFTQTEAIHIDVGRLARDISIKEPKNIAAHTHTIVSHLRTWLKEESPELSLYFEDKLTETFLTKS